MNENTKNVVKLKKKRACANHILQGSEDQRQSDFFQVGCMYINEMPLKESKHFVTISTSLQAIEAGLKPPLRAVC